MTRIDAIAALFRATGKPSDPKHIAEINSATLAFPEAILEAALGRLGRTAKFFPRLSEILDACHGEALRQPVAVASTDVPEDGYYCAECRDESSGWRSLWCVGIPTTSARMPQSYQLPVYTCDRRNPHAPHAYVEKCRCAGRNPKVQERAARLAGRVIATSIA